MIGAKYLLIFSLLVSKAFADSGETSISIVSPPGSTTAKLSDLLNSIPGGSSKKCMLNDFMDILRPGEFSEAAGTQLSNKGLDAYIDSLGNSKDFRDQAKSFYQEVDQILSSSMTLKVSDSGEMPTLSQKAGDADNPNLKPGWLWNLAMKHSKGDSNRAMDLIGICGNDDINQGSLFVEMNPTESQQEHHRRVEVASYVINNLKAKLPAGTTNHECEVKLRKNYLDLWKKNPEDIVAAGLKTVLSQCKDSSDIPKLISQIEKYRDSITPSDFKMRKIKCPEGSIKKDLPQGSANFFLPESLGKGVDISESLKKRIARSQIPFECDNRDNGATSDCLPAKYYHVYGSAMVACEMIARGYNPSTVADLSAFAGWYYRVLWISDIANGGKDNTGQNVPPLSKQQASDWLSALDKVKSMFGKNRCNTSKNPNEQFTSDSIMTDALELMRIRTVSGNFGTKIGSVYTNLPTNGPLLPDSDTILHPINSDRPTGWSDERYELASKKYDSIMADFDWTIAQHRLGAEFAATVCKPDPKK